MASEKEIPMTTPPVNNTSNNFDSVKKCFGKCWTGFKKCVADEKVQKVMLFVFSLIIGTAIGALVGTPIGATAIILGAVVGAVTGGIVFGAVTGVKYVIQMKGYPAHAHVIAKDSDGKKVDRKPLSVGKQGWETDDHLGVFKDVIKEEFANKQWFKDWKAHKGFKENNQAAEYLFGKYVRKGVSLGECQELLRAAKKDDKLKGVEFLTRVRAEGLFIRQIPEFIRKDLKNSDKETLKIQVEEEIHKFPDLILDESTQYELKKFQSFKTHLSRRLDTNLTGAIFQLKGKEDPALFIRLKAPYSFYDPFSNNFGGLHEEFKSPDEFIEKLYEHIKCYGSRWRMMQPLEWGTIKYYR